MTQLTKPEIVSKTKQFLDEIRVLVDDVKRTKQWLEMKRTEPYPWKKVEEKGSLKLRSLKSLKSEKENPFDDGNG